MYEAALWDEFFSEDSLLTVGVAMPLLREKTLAHVRVQVVVDWSFGC